MHLRIHLMHRPIEMRKAELSISQVINFLQSVQAIITQSLHLMINKVSIL